MDLTQALALDPASPTPPYEQVRDRLAALIVSGELADQARLPAIRALATSLGCAPGTVARAYSELEEAGLVATAGCAGTRVVGQAAGDGELAALADAYVSAARARGLDADALVAYVRSRALG